MSQNRPRESASLGDLIGGLAGDIQDLVRGEIALGRPELEQKLDRGIMAAIWLLGGALLAFAGLVVLFAGYCRHPRAHDADLARIADLRDRGRWRRSRPRQTGDRDAVAGDSRP